MNPESREYIFVLGGSRGREGKRGAGRRRRDRGRMLLFSVPVFFFLFWGGCSFLKIPKKPPVSADQISALLSEMKTQQDRVSTFYSNGQVSLKDGLLERESDILVVGTHSPFQVKIELTHSWGKPLLHVLISQDRLEVLSFKDQKFYVGAFTPEALSRFFPAPLEEGYVWAALRGYPAILVPDPIVSGEANRLRVLNEREEVVQTLDLSGPDAPPRRIRLPLLGIDMIFLDYQREEGICFAREVRVERPEEKKALILTRKKTVFNKPIPEEIFRLEKPPHFTQAGIDEIR